MIYLISLSEKEKSAPSDSAARFNVLSL